MAAKTSTATNAVKEQTPNIQPLGTRVLIRPIEQEMRTPSGLVLPETAKEKPQIGVVLAVGDSEDIKVKVNDKVLYAKYSGTEFKHDGVTYLIMDNNDILAIVRD
ncbi:MAG: co-chaperone GroES [Thermoflexales bacterium]|nr:co-chaperone GroES [Thermoflexales bacterium]MCS7323987.1 co-chaperone GroES [Thermoflexales bacterium]MCX7939435.1 co-chaperone GroES [Thermoflexales bacterium]MDW8052927.1 co-chaperone GroES [Anaerolineae bacterium]MDW8291578.1 co-chaperone GroES [Anaerolineae bacterium]